MNKSTSPEEISTDEAKDILGVTTSVAIIRLIERGKIKNARKLNPSKITSAWVVSRAEVIAIRDARLKKKKTQQKQRGQPSKTG